MSLKAWTVGMIIPLTAALAVSSAPTASAAETAPQVSSDLGVVQTADRVAGDPPRARNPVVRRPVVRDPVVRRPIFRDPVVRRPIFRDPVFRRPIFRDRLVRPIFRVRPIVLVDPFVQCSVFLDDEGEFIHPVFHDRFLVDPLFKACAEFFVPEGARPGHLRKLGP